MENNDWFKEYTKRVYKNGVVAGFNAEPECKFGLIMIKKDGSKEYKEGFTIKLTEEEITEIKQEYGK